MVFENHEQKCWFLPNIAQNGCSLGLI